jgi:hypothetical protein
MRHVAEVFLARGGAPLSERRPQISHRETKPRRDASLERDRAPKTIHRVDAFVTWEVLSD